MSIWIYIMSIYLGTIKGKIYHTPKVFGLDSNSDYEMLHKIIAGAIDNNKNLPIIYFFQQKIVFSNI